MSVARTMRDISKIPGVSSFRSPFRRPLPEQQAISLSPCNSCQQEFKFPPNTSWEKMTQTVEAHTSICGRVVASSNACSDGQAVQRVARGSKKRKKIEPSKTCRKLSDRKALLEDDPWTVTESVDAKRAQCAACGNVIILDQRRMYYPGLWIKHKERCARIDEVFERAERVLRPVIRKCFMMQNNPPERQFHDPYWFLELCGVVLGNRQRRKKKYHNGRIMKHDQRTNEMEHGDDDKDTEDAEMEGSDECLSIGAPQVGDDYAPRSGAYTGPTVVSAVANQPTSSKSLNAILCPVSVEVVQNRDRHLVVRTGRDQTYATGSRGSTPRGVASSGSHVELSSRGASSHRYRPYSKERRALFPSKMSTGIDGGEMPLTLNPDNSGPTSSYSLHSQDVVESETTSIYSASSPSDTTSTHFGGFDSRSEYGDDASWTSRASTPSTNGGEFWGIGRGYEDSGAHAYRTDVSPCSPSPNGTLVNISTLSRHESPLPSLIAVVGDGGEMEEMAEDADGQS